MAASLSARQPAASSAPEPAAQARSSQAIVACLCVALLAAALAVDPQAHAAFDAPKRLLVLLAIALAAAVWVSTLRGVRTAFASTGLARVALVGVLLAVAGSVLALTATQYLAGAWDVLRVALLFALLLPLGASAALAGPQARWLWRCAVLVIGTSAVLSLLQAVGVELPLEMVSQSGRFATGALLGNEGYVALACALLGAGAGALAVHRAVPLRRRIEAGLLLVLALLTIASNRQLTSGLALLCALLLVVALRLRQRWLLPLGAGLVLLAGITAAAPALRSLSWGQLPLSIDQYQQASTYRVGAWATALAMIEERPLTGWGPNGFASNAQRVRLDTEIALATRLRLPPKSNAFLQAHQEYLQLAAEAGVPVLLAVLVALGALLAGLQRLVRDRPDDPEPLVLLAVIVAGAVAALAWFPLQIPLTAVLLLLACGRGWRLLAGHGARR